MTYTVQEKLFRGKWFLHKNGKLCLVIYNYVCINDVFYVLGGRNISKVDSKIQAHDRSTTFEIA